VASRNSRVAAAWRLGPAGKMACVARGNAREPAWSPRADRARDGAVARSPMASRRQGVVRDLEGATGEVPGKEERTGAHQNGGPMVMRCKRRRTAVFNGGGVAPVVID
jgi:hypothetical protein